MCLTPSAQKPHKNIAILRLRSQCYSAASRASRRVCRSKTRYIDWNAMEYRFIDRFFHSQYELLDFSRTGERDTNTLYSFLNNLHTTADRLKEDFDCDIKS